MSEWQSGSGNQRGCKAAADVCEVDGAARRAAGGVFDMSETVQACEASCRGTTESVERRASSVEHDHNQGTSSSWAVSRRQESISTLDGRRTASWLGGAEDGWRGLVQDGGGAQRDAHEPDMEGRRCNSRETAERGIGSRASRPNEAWAGGKGDETMHGWQGRCVEAPQGTSHDSRGEGAVPYIHGNMASRGEAQTAREQQPATRPSEL
jgi:hypothetical protein